jgi:hypothetical protein
LSALFSIIAQFELPILESATGSQSCVALGGHFSRARVCPLLDQSGHSA